ncbi:molecular chaperone DnaJ [Sporolactobacillus sp. THM7-7]|nr:molecular chaperone DnaJ [Sporolactobacillus sp. THM7-7]
MGEMLLRVFMGLVAAWIALSKGRSPVIWFFLGLFFSWFAAIAVLFFPNKKLRRNFQSRRNPRPAANWHKRVGVHCPYCGTRVVIDDIPGNWSCPDCGETFTYSTDGQAYKIRRSQIDPPVMWMVKMFARLAKADGVVTENEVRQVDQIVRQGFRPSEDQLQRIMDLFNESRYSDEPITAIARQLYLSVGGRRDILGDALTALFAIAAADGRLHPQEGAVLATAANIFGMENEYEAIKARFFSRSAESGTSAEADLDACYRLLGASGNESDELIKKKYRRLIRENHPDRLVSRGASEESIRRANQKVAEIKQAYERIMATRA